MGTKSIHISSDQSLSFSHARTEVTRGAKQNPLPQITSYA